MSSLLSVETETMRKGFADTILKLSQEDEKVYIVDGDLGNSTKIDGVAKENPDKFLQMGIAEQNMLSASAGLATTGLKPWAVTFAEFMFKRAIDQIQVLIEQTNNNKIGEDEKKNPEKFMQMGNEEQNMLSASAGLATTGLKPWAVTFAAFMSKRAIDQIQVQIAQPKLNVNMVGSYSGLLTGLTGKTHQSLEDIAIFRSLANMTVLAPADAIEVEKMMQFAHQYDGPVYIRLARDAYPYIFDENYEFEVGKAVKLKEGKDATIIS